MRAGDLQADRQACASKPTRNRYRRQPPHIKRASVAQQKQLCGTKLFRMFLHVGNGRRRYGQSWSDQEIHVGKNRLDSPALFDQRGQSSGAIFFCKSLASADAPKGLRVIELGSFSH